MENADYGELSTTEEAEGSKWRDSIMLTCLFHLPARLLRVDMSDGLSEFIARIIADLFQAERSGALSFLLSVEREIPRILAVLVRLPESDERACRIASRSASSRVLKLLPA